MGRTRDVVLVGGTRAGKTTTARLIVAALGGTEVELGHWVRSAALAADFVGPVYEFADHLFRRVGSLAVVTGALAEATREATRPLIVVGPRRPEEVAYLRRRLRDPVVIALVTDFKLRVARAIPSEAASLRNREDFECGWGLEAAMAAADGFIDGSSDPHVTAERVLDAYRAEVANARDHRR